jgi:hypothetical protein
MDRTFRPINCLIARNLKTYLYQRRTNTGLNCGSDLDTRFARAMVTTYAPSKANTHPLKR